MTQSINAKLRSSHILRLIDGIGVIGPDFERFGGILMEQLLGIPLVHPGLNVLGFPIGGDVDTSSMDGQWVAEYSAENGYFRGDMPKAVKDLDHALEKRPAARQIALLSVQKRVAAAERRFRAAAEARPDMKGRTLHVWGAQDIATKIVDLLLTSERAVRLLSPYLPVLAALSDEQAASLQIRRPENGAIERLLVDQAIEAELAKSPCLVVSGHGGSGKSVAASVFAQRHKDDYYNQLWLKGSDVPDVESLSAVAMVRAGDSRNVTYLLKSRPTLLVIDDAAPELAADDLAALCGPGSHVIMTARRDEGYAVPPFSVAEARTVVNRDTAEPCPDDVLETIWAAVGGHPLTYGLINGAIKSRATWANIQEDCQIIGDLPDRSSRMADRLLARILPTLGKELALFHWIGQPDCDEGFATAALKPVGIRKLQDACLTTVGRANVVRLHDVVFSSLESVAESLPDRNAVLSDQLATYIENVATSGDGLPFWTVARSLDRRLRSAVSGGDHRPAFLYALLEISPPGALDPSLLEDPDATAGRLLAAPQDEVPAIQTMAIIETIEAGYLYRKTQADKPTAQAILTAQLPVFDRLTQHPRLTDKQVAELIHHKGKALLRLGDKTGAISLFEEVLAGKHPLHESRLQLVKLLAGDAGRQPEVEAMTGVLVSGYGGRGEVSTSVYLATVESLPWKDAPWRDALLKRHGPTIEAALIRLTNLGIGQAYRALASIGRYWSRKDPDAFLRVFDAVPPREPDAADEDGDLFAYAEMLFEASRRKPQERETFQQHALATYRAVSRLKPGYQTQRLAELLTEMHRPQEAIDLLEPAPDIGTSDFGQHRLSLAYLALGRLADAEAAIALALQLLSKEQFRPLFDVQAARVAAARADRQAPGPPTLP